MRRDTETTVIWRDGQILRTDCWGRTRELPSIHPLSESNELPAEIEL